MASSNISPVEAITSHVAEEMIRWSSSGLLGPPTSSWIRILDIASNGHTARPTSSFLQLNDPLCLVQCNWRATCLGSDDEAVTAILARAELNNGKVNVEKADLQALPCQDRSFTHAIWSIGPGNYAEDTMKALAKIHRVLEDGGKLTFSVMNTPRTFESILSQKTDRGEKAPWTDESENKAKLAEIGFYSVQFWKCLGLGRGLEPSEILEGISSLMPHLDMQVYQDYFDTNAQQALQPELFWNALIVTAAKR